MARIAKRLHSAITVVGRTCGRAVIKTLPTVDNLFIAEVILDLTSWELWSMSGHSSSASKIRKVSQGWLLIKHSSSEVHWSSSIVLPSVGGD